MSIEELIEKLESTRGPFYALDQELFLELAWEGQGDTRTPPNYTASVDAALALVERKLPGWGYRIGTCHLSDDAFVFPDFNSPKHGKRLKEEFPDKFGHQEWADHTDIDLRPSGRLPIAILMSLLTALSAIEILKSQEATHD